MRTWTKRGEVIEALRAEPGLRVKNGRGVVYRWGGGLEYLESVSGEWWPAAVSDGPWAEVIANHEPRRAGPYVECSFDEADQADSRGRRRVVHIGNDGDWFTWSEDEGGFAEACKSNGCFWARLDRSKR